jgi:uncharacterized membrane protein YhaH (DUF805 family)
MNKHSGHQMPKWMWILCIGVPVLGLTTWLLIPSSSTSLVKLLPYALFLLCPLSHFLMMPMMHRSKDHHSEGQDDEKDSKEKPGCH